MEKSLIDKTTNEWDKNYSAMFGLALITGHNRAVAKHPMTGMRCKDDWGEVQDQGLELLRITNDTVEKQGEYTWQGILSEEVAEAHKEIANGNFDAAQAEAVQVAQVAFRMWLWCEEQKQKEQKEVK